MPKQYEEIRDSYVRRGKSLKEAKKLAAMTYNAHRAAGVAPVTGKAEGEKPKKLGDELASK